MIKYPHLVVHMRFESDQKIDNNISLNAISCFLQEKIQDKFPLYNIHIGNIKMDWPGCDVPKHEQDLGKNIK